MTNLGRDVLQEEYLVGYTPIVEDQDGFKYGGTPVYERRPVVVDDPFDYQNALCIVIFGIAIGCMALYLIFKLLTRGQV